MTRRSLLTLLLVGILLASCSPSADGQPTPDIKGTIEANAQTMVAALFLTQTALAPAATNTPLPTVTLLPSSTALALPSSSPTVFVAQSVYLSPTPTGTYYTATPLASSLGVGCKNLRLIESFTSPEGPFLPGQSFTQSWQVENNGTCDWMYTFEWVFVSGDKMGSGSSVRLGKKIEPYKWTTLSVNLTAPKNTGKYSATWRLSDAGSQFGAGLPVSITVSGSTSTPKPDTAATNAAAAAQTVAAAAQQTIAAQNAINTAVAGTLTKEAQNAAGTASAVAATNAAAVAQTAVCAQTPAVNPAPNAPCIVVP